MAVNEDQAWAMVASMLEHNWPDPVNRFTDMTVPAYKATLGREFSGQTVAAALGEIVCRGVNPHAHDLDKKRRPSAPEIATECHRVLGTTGDRSAFDAPSWVECYPWIEGAAYRHQRGAEDGAASVLEKLGPVASAWFMAGGCQMLTAGGLGPEHPYGERNRADVRRSYEEFVRVQRDRVSKGLTTAGRPDGLRGGVRIAERPRIGA